MSCKRASKRYLDEWMKWNRMWLFRSEEEGKQPVIIFKYSETCAGDTAVEFLQGFS